MKTIFQAVGASTYPGRGILIGKSADAKSALLAYFIMGRSVNSRNRVFVEDGSGIRTEAFDPSLMQDPSLIIYSPVRVFEKSTIVTNGNQTDTIYDFIKEGSSFHKALSTRTFEPDAPNYTPRISALLRLDKHDFSLAMGVVRAADASGTAALHSTFEYDRVAPGTGYFIHTYAADGNPIPSFTGEPETVSLGNTLQETADAVWNALNADNKVSLWVRRIDLESARNESVIFNKNHR